MQYKNLRIASFGKRIFKTNKNRPIDYELINVQFTKKNKLRGIMRKLHGPLHWGIFGTGKICSDFVTILNTLPKTKHITFGVASRDVEKARQFGKSHGIQNVFRSYKDLAENPNIDVIYIGTVNSEHYPQAMLAIKNKKHVLLEKPISVNFKQCNRLVEAARQNGVFLMEGFWTTTFPAAKKFFTEIKNGAIGDIILLTLEIGGGVQFSEFDRFRLKDLCGGALLNHGVYGLMLTYLLLGKPDRVSANGFLMPSGVDETTTVTMSYKETAAMSNIVVTSRAKMPSELCVVGTKGNAKLCFPFWAPSKCELPNETFYCPLPKCEGLDETTKFNYPYATGFVYEIEEVYRCISEGLQESPSVPWKACLEVMRIADEARRQLGISFSEDEE